MIQRIVRFTQAALKSYGPSGLKKVMWDREYATDKWNFADNTAHDCVYPLLEKYAAGGTILDLGCGSGNTANELKESAYAKYLGVDISENCLEKARRRSEKNGRGKKNAFTVGDILHYVPEQKFDVILLRESLYHVPAGKIEATLSRYAKYLKDGGVLIVRMGVLDDNGLPKARPTAMFESIEKAFHVVENSHNAKQGATVMVFRLKG